jgi:hypothetical protein
MRQYARHDPDRPRSDGALEEPRRAQANVPRTATAAAPSARPIVGARSAAKLTVAARSRR